MKTFRFSLAFLALIALVTIFGCGSTDNVVEPPTRADLLTGKTWRPGTVTVIANGTPENTSRYNAFSIVFRKDPNNAERGTYTSANGFDGFPQSEGTWEFRDNGTLILRGDGVSMTVTTLTASNLVLNFTIQGRIGGRYASAEREQIIPTRVFTFNLVP